MIESRTKNTAINFAFGAFAQVINTIVSFLVRTVFIKILGKEYLGINGLFTNILTVLSFAELGIGNAIIYNMYKPIAENKKEKVKSLMQLYKHAYTIIGITVFCAGVLIIPFLDNIIKDQPNIKESLAIIYFLYLLNTSLSYFVTYKKSIISAYQQEYVISRYKILFFIIKSVLQIVCLVVTHNFIAYLLIQIVCTFLENLSVSIKAENMYPYLRETNIDKIDKEEKVKIFNNVKALVMYKFGSVILNGTDNIIISKMIGVITVGIYSNYLMIVSAVTSIVSSALAGFTSSIGNLNATATNTQKEKVFYDMFFITAWILGFCTIALLLLINPFIEIWVGKEYLLDNFTVFAIALHFFINGMQTTGYIYRTTSGLFVKGKSAPIIAATINIFLSIVLGKYIGIAGIILATSISRILTTSWLDPVLVHKYELKKSPIKYFKEYAKYLCVIIINYFICYLVTRSFRGGFVNFIKKGVIITIFSNMVFLAFFYKKHEFKNFIERVKMLLKNEKRSSC